MKKILVICAMEKEAMQLAKKMELRKQTETILNGKILQGSWKEKEITILITGIGKQKTAIQVSNYLTQFPKPDKIVNIGYCGATKTPVGTWIDVTKSYNYEWNIPGEERYEMKDIAKQDLEITQPSLKQLPCYSAESFVTQTNICEEILFDMELHSIAILCDAYQIPLEAFKKVSDNLNIDSYYETVGQQGDLELVSALDFLE